MANDEEVQDKTNTDVADETKEVKPEDVLYGEKPEGKEPEGKEPEGKEPEGKEPEGKEPEGKEPEGKDAPEKYEDFQLPKGMKISDDAKSEFASMAKEYGLTQEKAQKLIDLASKNAQAQHESILSEWAKQRETMVKDLKADKEFGGAKFTETIERAKRTLNKFGSSDLVKFLEDSGAGDHKELVKMLARVDKTFGEDHTEDGTKAEENVDPANILYPNMKGK